MSVNDGCSPITKPTLLRMTTLHVLGWYYMGNIQFLRSRNTQEGVLGIFVLTIIPFTVLFSLSGKAVMKAAVRHLRSLVGDEDAALGFRHLSVKLLGCC